MTRFLDWLDESAAGLIRVAYLLAGIIAVAVYFGAGTVPAGVMQVFNAALPWVLAAALETHTYLTARRVRAAFQDLQASSDPGQRHTASRAMKVNLGILAGLLAFSMWNQLQYLAATWTPPHTALTLPGPLAYVVRAVVVPGAFMAAAFLAPIGESLAAQIHGEAKHFASSAFKVARRQWKARLKEMQRTGQDVSAALVQLVPDDEERRVVEVIYEAIFPDHARVRISPDRTLLSTESDLPQIQAGSGAMRSQPTPNSTDVLGPYPTGGGTPQAARTRSKRVQADTTRVVSITKPKRRRLTAAERIARVLERYPDASLDDLARMAKVGKATAVKYRKAEQQRQVAQ